MPERIFVENITPMEPENIENYDPSKSSLQEIDAQMIQLLQERVVVNSQRRKIGEVIVRKEVETRMIQVPVRREKLIVEQVSPERKELVSLDLGMSESETVKLVEEAIANQTVSCEFSSPSAAIEYLQSLGGDPSSKIDKIRIEFVGRDSLPSLDARGL